MGFPIIDVFLALFYFAWDNKVEDVKRLEIKVTEATKVKILASKLEASFLRESDRWQCLSCQRFPLWGAYSLPLEVLPFRHLCR